MSCSPIFSPPSVMPPTSRSVLFRRRVPCCPPSPSVLLENQHFDSLPANDRPIILNFWGSSHIPQLLSMKSRLTPTEVADHRLRLPISPQRRASCPPNGRITTAAVICPTRAVASTPGCSPGHTLPHQTRQCEPVIVRITLNCLRDRSMPISAVPVPPSNADSGNYKPRRRRPTAMVRGRPHNRVVLETGSCLPLSSVSPPPRCLPKEMGLKWRRAWLRRTVVHRISRSCHGRFADELTLVLTRGIGRWAQMTTASCPWAAQLLRLCTGAPLAGLGVS